jgi:hypothetical protein
LATVGNAKSQSAWTEFFQLHPALRLLHTVDAARCRRARSQCGCRPSPMPCRASTPARRCWARRVRFCRRFRVAPLEAAHSTYWGDNANILGFNHLASLGVGFEFDSSADDVFVTRTRLVARFDFGRDVSGFAVGLAMRF